MSSKSTANFIGEIFAYITLGYIIFTIFAVYVYLNHIPHFELVEIIKYFRNKIFNKSILAEVSENTSSSKFFKIKLLLFMAMTRFLFIYQLLRFGDSLGIVDPTILTPFGIFFGVFGIFLVETGLFTTIILPLVEIILPILLDLFSGVRIFYASMFGVMNDSINRIPRTTLTRPQVRVNSLSRREGFPIIRHGVVESPIVASSKIGGIPSFQADYVSLLDGGKKPIRINEAPVAGEYIKKHKLSLSEGKIKSFDGLSKFIPVDQFDKKVKLALLNNIARALSIGTTRPEYLDIFKADTGLQNHLEERICKSLDLGKPAPYVYGVNGRSSALITDLLTELRRPNVSELGKSRDIGNDLELVIYKHFPNVTQKQLFRFLVELSNTTTELANLATYPYDLLERYDPTSKVGPFSRKFTEEMTTARAALYDGLGGKDNPTSAIFDFISSTKNDHTAFEAKGWHENHFGSNRIKFNSIEDSYRILGKITSASFSTDADCVIAIGGNNGLCKVNPQFPLGVRFPFKIPTISNDLPNENFKKFNHFCLNLVKACQNEGLTTVGMIHTFNGLDWRVPVDNQYLRSWLTEFDATINEKNGVIFIGFNPIKIAEVQIERLEKYENSHFSLDRVLTDQESEKFKKLKLSIDQLKLNSKFFTTFNQIREEVGADIKVEYKIVIDNSKSK